MSADVSASQRSNFHRRRCVRQQVPRVPDMLAAIRSKVGDRQECATDTAEDMEEEEATRREEKGNAWHGRISDLQVLSSARRCSGGCCVPPREEGALRPDVRVELSS
jgi:hypothetical protein